MARELMKGNEAIAEAAVRVGLQSYFGYPITPQTELLEYLSRRMPELGRTFVQAESEVAAINMIYGAASTGVRCMTSSSSPGISLMMEGVSYIAASEIPMVFINVMRGGPGLGNISPSQADYNQIVHGGGHGDYEVITLAPASVQEMVDHIVLAFDLAEKYNMVTCVLSDGSIGQMMEPCELPEMRPLRKENEYAKWATRGKHGRAERNIISSIYLNVADGERANYRMMNKWQQVKANEVRYKDYYLDDADIAIVGFGSAGRIALTAVRKARAEGIRVGLVRPITLWPFPEKVFQEAAEHVSKFLSVEISMGQMVEDIRLAVNGRVPVEFYGRIGLTPNPEEITRQIVNVAQKEGWV